MEQTSNATLQPQQFSLTKRMLAGATIGLFLIALFLFSAPAADPAWGWGKYWMVKPLILVTLFHMLGLMMELYKVRMGSWSYPEEAYSKIGGVPLYSGFMYASVGSYVCQAWRWFNLRLINWPGIAAASLISMAIYLNFFTHHFMYDLRWVITGLLIVIFRKTKIVFQTNGYDRKMPLVLSFLLIGFMIWIAENLATFLGAWKYASQHEGWRMVSLGKISSWFLLVVLSIVIVIQLKFIRYGNTIFSKTTSSDRSNQEKC